MEKNLPIQEVSVYYQTLASFFSSRTCVDATNFLCGTDRSFPDFVKVVDILECLLTAND